MFAVTFLPREAVCQAVMFLMCETVCTALTVPLPRDGVDGCPVRHQEESVAVDVAETQRIWAWLQGTRVALLSPLATFDMTLFNGPCEWPENSAHSDIYEKRRVNTTLANKRLIHVTIGI